MNKKIDIISDLKKVVVDHIFSIIIILILYGMLSLTSVFPTKLIGSIVDLISTTDGKGAMRLIILYIVIRLLNLLFRLTSVYLQDKVKIKIVKKLRTDNLNRLMNIRYVNDFFDTNTTQYVSRIIESVDLFVQALFDILVWLGKSLPTLLLTFFYLYEINSIIALIIIPLLLVMSLIVRKVSDWQKKISYSEFNYKSQIIDLLNELTQSIETTKLYNMNKYLLNKYSASEIAWGESKAKLDVLNSMTSTVLSFFGIVVISLIFLISISDQVLISPGDITSLVLYSGNIFMIILEVFDNITVFNKLVSSYKRLDELFVDKEFIYLGDKKEIQSYDIRLENVCFSYKEKEILNNINLTIPHGAKVAIIGSNGSGKTTILKLIAGLYKVTNGNLYLGDLNYSEIPSSQLYECMAFASQNPFVYEGTVRDNIIFESNNENNNQILNLCGINEEGVDLEKKVINNGENLSGGQKQRISLARTLVKNSEIICVDEFENNLDTTTTSKIRDYLFSLDKTVIINSHDIDTIENADILLKFTENGIEEIIK